MSQLLRLEGTFSSPGELPSWPQVRGPSCMLFPPSSGGGACFPPLPGRQLCTRPRPRLSEGRPTSGHASLPPHHAHRHSVFTGSSEEPLRCCSSSLLQPAPYPTQMCKESGCQRQITITRCTVFYWGHPAMTKTESSSFSALSIQGAKQNHPTEIPALLPPVPGTSSVKTGLMFL